MPDTPMFSIVIPTRNRAATLKWALRTCLDVDYPNFEIVVSDNDSSDNTAEAISGFRDKRIRHVKTDTYVAMGRNFENGLRNARGEFLIFLGDDDGILPFSLRSLELAFARYPDVDVVDWVPNGFVWPNAKDASLRMYWVSNLIGNEIETAAQAWFRINHPRSPEGNEVNGFNLYNACVRRSVTDAAVANGVRLFASPAPDVASGIRILGFARAKLRLQVALTIISLSRESLSLATNSPSQSDRQQQIISDFRAMNIRDFPESALVRNAWTRTHAFLSPLIDEHLKRRGDLRELDLERWRLIAIEGAMHYRAERIHSFVEDFNQVIAWMVSKGAKETEPLTAGEIDAYRNAKQSMPRRFNHPLEFSDETIALAATKTPRPCSTDDGGGRIVSIDQNGGFLTLKARSPGEEFTTYDYVAVMAALLRCDPFDVAALLINDPFVLRSEVILRILERLARSRNVGARPVETVV